MFFINKILKGYIMDYEVYCDEAFPDLFTSKHSSKKFLTIGALWLEKSMRTDIKEKINEIRKKHNAWGEIKWNKISQSKLDFYFDLVDLFMSYGYDLRFRCIVIDSSAVDLKLHHNNDGELGFYKFYYQLLHHWILDFNTYSIFCDTKTNKDPERIKILHRCLKSSNLSSEILNVQALPSKEVVLIQLSDFLLGMASARMNNTLKENSAKSRVVEELERKLNVHRLGPTYQNELKYNVFNIRLDGGW